LVPPAIDNRAQRVLITLYDIRAFHKRYPLLNLGEIQCAADRASGDIVAAKRSQLKRRQRSIE
jgi:hypothetical protein